MFRIVSLAFLPCFIVAALYLNWDQGPFNFDGPLWPLKVLVWLLFAAFTLYSGYCTLREDLIDTVKKINQWHFGRQICLDLYLGLVLAFTIMYLNEPTLLGLIAWIIPTLFYVNILTLLYLAIHFDQIVARFIA